MPPVILNSLLSSFSRFVEEQTGLHFAENRWADLERGVVAAAKEFGAVDGESFMLNLMAAAPAREQLEALAASLTVGETYFFRDKRVFELLETDLLPRLIEERRGGSRHLRIWSAGCCTGEEPYSVAMLLTRLLPDIADWKITILATDINERFLSKAAEGIYSQWSFRETPEEVKRKFFIEKGEGRFEILPALKSLVCFAYLNLSEDVYPAPANNTAAMDIIFCRNVLMYFSPERARQAALRLGESLVEGGWFISSPSEASAELLAPLIPGDFSGAILYRKPRPGEKPPAPAPQPLAAEMRVPRVDKPPARHSAETVAEKPLPRSKERSPDLVASARAEANSGNLKKALALCEKAISADRLLPGSEYLRGVILQEQGALREAIASLKRALYLDPNLVVAHFALGNILRGMGSAEAPRHFYNAVELLRRQPPDTLLPESEGITAGRLLEIIQTMQEKHE